MPHGESVARGYSGRPFRLGAERGTGEFTKRAFLNGSFSVGRGDRR
ncbi:MAG: hypothetical protein ACLS4Z_07010 [Christensenellaceae bacterium]